MSGYKFGTGGPSWNGIPMINGVPVTFGNTQNAGAGKIFYVNPTTGSDGNKGTSIDKPFATISNAYSSTTSNNHDVIVLSATSAHAATNELTVSNNRTHFYGMDAVKRIYGQRSRWTMGVTTGSAIAIVQNTGVGNTFTNIKFDSADTLATSLYAFADGGEYTVLEWCEVVKSTFLDQTTAAYILCNGDSSYYHHCLFGSLVYQISAKRPVMLLNRTTIAGKVARDVLIQDSKFWINTTSSNASCIHGDGATDIERIFEIERCSFVNAVLGSADCDQAVEFDSAPTEGYLLATDCSCVGFTAFSTTTGVFSATSVKSATGPEAIQAS